MRRSLIGAAITLIAFVSACEEQRTPLEPSFSSQAGNFYDVTYAGDQGVSNGNDVAPQLLGVNVAGQRRLLICVVSIERNDSPVIVTDVSMDNGAGVAVQHLTQLGGYYAAPSDGLKWSTWYLVSPRTGDRRVVASLSAVAPWELACDSYNGVNQGQPFGPVAVSVGTSGDASLTVVADHDGSLPWAHLFSTNAGYVAGAGVVNRQKSTTHPMGLDFSFMVEGDSSVADGSSYTFNWSYAGEFGSEGAVLRPATR